MDFEAERKRLQALKSSDPEKWRQEMSGSWENMDQDLRLMNEVVQEYAQKTGQKFSLYKDSGKPGEWSEEFQILLKRFVQDYGEAEALWRLERTLGYFSSQVRQGYN